MKLVRTEKQKDNLAKFFWDISKVAFAVSVIGPLAKPESISLFGLAAGLAIGLAFSVAANMIDSREWR